MKEQDNNANGVRTAAMPKVAVKTTRASLVELIKRTNQTSLRITAK